MANVVEALLVTLGLDASQYRKEAAAARADQGKVIEQSDKMAKRLESDGKRAATSLRGVRNEVAGLLLAFTGAATLGTFAKSILTNDAAVGRLAGNLGVATAELSKWEAMVQRVGGQAGDADSAFRSLKSIFNDVRLTGNMSAYGDLAGLGITDVNQLKNPDQALLAMAGTGERMDRSEFAARLGRLGISDSMITLLGKGRAGVSAYLAEQEKLGHATEESSRQAQRLEDALARMDSLLREKLRPLLTDVVEWFNQWAGNTENLDNAAAALLITLGGLAIWVIAAAAPWIAFAAAIALVLNNLDRLKAVAAALLAGDFRGAWGILTAGPAGGLSNPGAVSDNWIGKVQAAGPGGGGGSRGGRRTMGWTPRIGENPDASVNNKIALIARGAGVDPDAPLTLSQFLALDMTALEGRPAGQHNYGNMRNMDGSWKQFGSRGEYTAAQRAWLQRRWTRQGARTIRDAVEGTPVGGTAGMSGGLGILGGRAPVGVGARGGGSSTTTMSVGTVVINTAATDAVGIARDLPRALADRGLAVQSASGMNP